MRIDAVDDYERSLRRLTRHWLRRVDRLAKKAEKGDVDAVHDMRTGVRRLRTLLGLAVGKRARRLRKRAKRLGFALGAVRDLDVALAHVREGVVWGQLSSDEGVDAWIAALARERATALRALRRTLRGPFRAWRRRVRRWTATGKSGPRVHEGLPLALGSLLSDCEALVPPADEVSLHELRKAIKRLRYALEFFEKVLPEEASAVAKRLTAAQDAIGEHRDRLVLAERAAREADAAATMGEDPRDLRAYARRLDEAREGDAVEVAREALKATRTLVKPS